MNKLGRALRARPPVRFACRAAERAASDLSFTANFGQQRGTRDRSAKGAVCFSGHEGDAQLDQAERPASVSPALPELRRRARHLLPALPDRLANIRGKPPIPPSLEYRAHLSIASRQALRVRVLRHWSWTLFRLRHRDGLRDWRRLSDKSRALLLPSRAGVAGLRFFPVHKVAVFDNLSADVSSNHQLCALLGIAVAALGFHLYTGRRIWRSDWPSHLVISRCCVWEATQAWLE